MKDKIIITAEADELTIEPKNGKVIDLENSDLSVGKIVFKKKEKELPTKWEDLKYINGYFTDLDSYCHYTENTKAEKANRDIFPTKEEAEACLALSQLCQLRDAYNGEHLADWCDWENENQVKYVVFFINKEINNSMTYDIQEVLTFKTRELRDKFLENFEELILTAKPLL